MMNNLVNQPINQEIRNEKPKTAPPSRLSSLVSHTHSLSSPLFTAPPTPLLPSPHPYLPLPRYSSSSPIFTPFSFFNPHSSHLVNTISPPRRSFPNAFVLCTFGELFFPDLPL